MNRNSIFPLPMPPPGFAVTALRRRLRRAGLAVNDHVLASGVPDGLVSHSAGFDEDAGVFRVFDIWESQAHAQAREASVIGTPMRA